MFGWLHARSSLHPRVQNASASQAEQERGNRPSLLSLAQFVQARVQTCEATGVAESTHLPLPFLSQLRWCFPPLLLILFRVGQIWLRRWSRAASPSTSADGGRPPMLFSSFESLIPAATSSKSADLVSGDPQLLFAGSCHSDGGEQDGQGGKADSQRARGEEGPYWRPAQGSLVGGCYWRAER
uniref:Uncharacterized protein n=1 Tax=Leersia perrieri TaxID=77586 RepID=A0A0D9XPT3_9ORYZ